MNLNFEALDLLMSYINYTPREFLEWLDAAYERGARYPCIRGKMSFVILDKKVTFINGYNGLSTKGLPHGPIENSGASFLKVWTDAIDEKIAYYVLRAKFMIHYELKEEL